MPGHGAPTRSRTRAGFLISLLGLLALQPPPLEADVLEGRLLDAEAGEPVAGALLTLRSPSGSVRSARSDTAGAFRVEDLPAGAWDVSVGRLGYRPHQARLRTGDGLAFVEWRLEPRARAWSRDSGHTWTDVAEEIARGMDAILKAVSAGT